MMMENTFSGTRSVTATFDSGARAERAIARLRAAGLGEDQMQLVRDPVPQPAPAAPAAPSAPARKARRSFVDSLVDFVFPDDEPAPSGAAPVVDGPCTLTVTRVLVAMYDQVVQILNEDGKVKLDMRRTDLADASRIKGFIGACLVDSDSGLMLASEGGGKLDLGLVAALNTDAVRAEQNAIHQLGLDQKIEDILITLDKQVHLIRPLERNKSMFVYVALDKASSNLGMARIQLKNIEAGMNL